MHVLGPDGTILFAAPSVRDLTGWTVEEVTGRALRDLIHADDVDSFVRDFNSSLTKGHELNVYYRFRMKDERYTIFEVAGHPYFTVSEETGERVCKCFFGMGRPYPSKNTAMLDSFLELKMENERLRQELQVMYRDIEGGSPYSPQPFGHDPRSFGSPFSGPDAMAHSPPHYDPRAANGGSVIDPNTGLVHASGLIPSSSNTYGALGIGISATGTKGDGTGDKKKKKQRVEDGDFVCRDCGTVDSPEWRKGPEGPKSLCNACGLRYAKLRSKDKLKGDAGKP
ncbi:GATA-domain-containing protein [Meredithblackwellia eburnea MCA 4105]